MLCACAKGDSSIVVVLSHRSGRVDRKSIVVRQRYDIQGRKLHYFRKSNLSMASLSSSSSSLKPSRYVDSFLLH